MKISPLWIAAIIGGGLLYMSRKRTPAVVATAGQLPPSGGPSGDGNVNASADGFVLTTDCAHMIVNDPQKASATINAFYRSNILNGGPLFIGMPGSADAHARAFFTHYWKVMAPNCSPKAPISGIAVISPHSVITGPYGTTYVLPFSANLSHQIMYAALFATMASYLVSDGRWTQDVAAHEVGRVVDLLKLNGVTKADWNEVFQGTVPMPNALRPELGVSQ